ncbi:hypothetical protein KC726_03965 [Candidatus Woesebacteria bacterium]|nr:hypothetical protein [Candidatus Woesebacteria bacterium]
MKKQTQTLLGKEMKELRKEVATLREELTRLQIEKHVKPEKDTNITSKKRKQLAYLLTIIRQKELSDSQKQS